MLFRSGQFETDFMFTDALNMADRLVYFRMMANEIARKHGAFASFMAKPFADRTGSGAHFNMSLADIDSGKNLFEPDGDDPHQCGVSPLAYHFIAGVLKHSATPINTGRIFLRTIPTKFLLQLNSSH